jgi:dTDP-4-dehydrorhamnose reductase
MKYMIIGASGYLGNTIYKKLLLKKSEQVYGTCYHNSLPELININLTDTSDIQKIILLKPNTIIWSACDLENEINLTQTGLQECINNLPNDVRFLYVSTMVGIGKNQSESTIPHIRADGEYLKNYINGKIEGEQTVSRHENHVIIRPGSIYGYDYDGNMDMRMKRLFDIYSSGQVYTRTANMYTSFVNIMDLADAIIELANNDFRGTINISGENPISYFEFNKHLASLLHIDRSAVATDIKPNDIYNTFDNTLRNKLLKTKINEIL